MRRTLALFFFYFLSLMDFSLGVSHDLDEAVLLGDRIFFLSKPPTRVHAEQLIPLKHPRSLELMTSNDFHQMKSEALTIFQASIAEKY